MTLHRCPLLLMLVAFIVASMVVSCGGNSEIDSQLTKAEEIMEQHPDSAYTLLKSIDKDALSTRKDKARYALFMSQALDKNYIDTTTFNVLQPAIDYYLDNGTPDEKLRTYYYQGCIFLNKGDRDNALNSFVKGLDYISVSHDSLCIARTFVAQARLYRDFYDFNSYTNSYLKAANIYKYKGLQKLEFDCLLNALNGTIILKNKSRADSIINICNQFMPCNAIQNRILKGYMLSYTLIFGSKEELKDLIYYQDQNLGYDTNGLLNLASAYNKLGDNLKAKKIIEHLDNRDAEYDTLKYQYIKVSILDSIGEYKEAFSTYRDFSLRLDSINAIKFKQKAQTIEEKHKIELQAQEAEGQKSQIIWGSLGIVMLLCIIILTYSLYVKKIKIEHTNDLVQIRSLRNDLFESGKQQEEMSNRIERLFGMRFKLLDGLASSYFECKETGQEQKRIYAEVKNSLSDFSSDTATQELADVVNGYKNGLMDHFKSDYPKLSASQYRLALYLFCGFSLPSISIFIGSDLRNIYVYKSRLKSIISKGETPRKEEYLKYFA